MSKVLGTIGLLLVATMLAAAPGKQILLVARDLADRPLSGIRFSYEKVKSRPTNRTGATELDLPPDQKTGQQIKIVLVASTKGKDWFLVNPLVNIPDERGSIAVVLMRRSEFRQFAAAARDASRPPARVAELSAEDRKQILRDTAARYGLTAEQLETAIRSFAETEDAKDRG